MLEGNELYKLISQKIEAHSGVLFGVSSTSYSEYFNKYNTAIVLAVSHKETITLNNYSEERLHKMITETQEEINFLVAELTKLLDEQGIDYFIPPMAQKDEETLLAPFSFKYAAVNAGLGWIGKNGVLITEKYGPRVRLSAILVNSDLAIGTPLRESRCPKDCFLCVNACPYKALKGVQWDIKKKRQELIDYHLCNTKRSEHRKKDNNEQGYRKHNCGFCMVACPVGL